MKPSSESPLDAALTRLETAAQARVSREAEGADALVKLEARRAKDHLVDNAISRMNAVSDLLEANGVAPAGNDEGRTRDSG